MLIFGKHKQYANVGKCGNYQKTALIKLINCKKGSFTLLLQIKTYFLFFTL